MSKVLLTDIANRLGVSTAVVSLILNGKAKENRVSDKLIRKVSHLAQEMNYSPNYHARSLRTGKNFTLGVIMSDISNPLFAKMARNIEDAAYQQGYQVIMVSSDEKAARTEQQIHLLNNKVDGMIIVPAADTEKSIMHLKKEEKPFILVDRFFPRIDTSYVVSDNFKGAFDATQHLIKSGFKKIGFISYNNKLQNYKDRLEGYREAMKKSRLRVQSGWVSYVDFENDHVIDIVNEMVNSSTAVRALLLANNIIGVKVLQALNKLRIRVPQDIAIVSFDDDNAFQLFYSPVTIVQQPFEKMARRAVELLINKIEGKSNEHQTVIMETTLVIRNSSNIKI